MSCVWCHNPESKKTVNELYFNKADCIGCNSCKSVCELSALSDRNKYFVDREKCNLCFKCVDACPSKALTKAGKHYTIDELFEKIISDKIFYDISGGGVTLSGGEVTLFSDFAGKLLERCKQHNINTLIETCGFFKYEKFEKEMLPFIDTIYYDLKIFDNAKHHKFCGVSNDIILNNFKQLLEYSKSNSLTLLPRVPLIPNITDTVENLTQIADFLASLAVNKVELLPYNPTWYPKNEAIGVEIDDSIKHCTAWQSKEKTDECKNIFTCKNIVI